jgi:hypothetical protein
MQGDSWLLGSARLVLAVAVAQKEGRFGGNPERSEMT